MFKSSVIVRANGEEFETHNSILETGYEYFYSKIFGLTTYNPLRLTIVNSSSVEISDVTAGRPIWDYEFITDRLVGNINFVNLKFKSTKDVAGIATLFEDSITILGSTIISVSSFVSMIKFPSVIRTDLLSIKYNIFI